jgi:hypothetical protein
MYSLYFGTCKRLRIKKREEITIQYRTSIFNSRTFWNFEDGTYQIFKTLRPYWYCKQKYHICEVYNMQKIILYNSFLLLDTN